jgi:hypothetical protein
MTTTSCQHINMRRIGECPDSYSYVAAWCEDCGALYDGQWCFHKAMSREEDIVQLREKVAESRYIWVRLVNGCPVEACNTVGGPETVTDGSVWWRFVLADDVRKAINEWASETSTPDV